MSINSLISKLMLTSCVLAMATQPHVSGQSRGSTRPVSESDVYYDTGYHPSTQLPDSAWRAFSRWLKKQGFVEGRHLRRDDVNQTVIHLSDRRKRDFLVQGATTWLTGADNSWYWVLANLRGNYRVVLFAHTGDLKFQSVRSHGMRDIHTFLTIGGTNYVNRYKFDGRTYKAHTCTETDLITKKTKRSACRG